MGGFCIMPVVPFNKRMWSISYNFLMAGSACLMFTVLRALEISAARTGQRAQPLLPSTQGEPQETQVSSGAVCHVAHVIGILLTPFRWLGTNALLFFVLSDSGGILTNLVSSVYFERPENNLVTWFQGDVLMGW